MITKNIVEARAEKYKIHAESHKHRPRELGASGLSDCQILSICKDFNLDMPEKNEIQNDSTTLYFGNDIHQMLDDYCIERGYDVEVYVKAKVGVYTIISPIDVSKSHSSDKEKKAIEEKLYSFKNRKISILVATKEAIFDEIGDIKGLRDRDISKYMNGAPFPLAYQYQFHFYMYATKLKKLEIIALSKESGHCYSFIYEWNNAIWENLKLYLKRRRELWKEAKALIKESKDKSILDQIEFRKEDLACVCQNGIPWWTCSLAKTITVPNPALSHRRRQILIKHCKYCKPFFEEKALEILEIGAIYKRPDLEELKYDFFVKVKDIDKENKTVKVCKMRYKNETTNFFIDSFEKVGAFYKVKDT